MVNFVEQERFYDYKWRDRVGLTRDEGLSYLRLFLFFP